MSFPDSDETSTQGFHSDKILAFKENQDEACTTENEVTTWGCTHSGNAAYSKNPYQNEYYSTSETVDIPTALAGKFNLVVHHVYKDSLETFFHSIDHIYAGKMQVSINGEDHGLYDHESHIHVDSHNDDGSRNPDYKGSFNVTIDCDSECNCITEKSASYHFGQ